MEIAAWAVGDVERFQLMQVVSLTLDGLIGWPWPTPSSWISMVYVRHFAMVTAGMAAQTALAIDPVGPPRPSFGLDDDPASFIFGGLLSHSCLAAGPGGAP